MPDEAYTKSEGYRETNSSFYCPPILKLRDSRNPEVFYEALRADGAELVMQSSSDAEEGGTDPSAFLALGQRAGELGIYLALDADTAEAFAAALIEGAKVLRQTKGETK